jgi:uncharacterized membrane protein YfcA
MSDLAWYQYVLIGLVFVWSGFVRTGIGFVGAVLALPFLLLVVNDPVIFLPLIAVHLLLASTHIMWRSHRRQSLSGDVTVTQASIDWVYLRHTLKIMIIPKLIGVIGLLTLSPKLMSVIILVIVMSYAFGYVLNRPIKPRSKSVEKFFLMLGGYVSGTSLTGAPLIVPIYASNVQKYQLRDTLFVLWFILTSIKLMSFVVAGVDLQLIHHLWLLPCAIVGHVLGDKLHERVVAAESPLFFRYLGVTLIIVSLAGLWRALAS